MDLISQYNLSQVIIVKLIIKEAIKLLDMRN